MDVTYTEFLYVSKHVPQLLSAPVKGLQAAQVLITAGGVLTDFTKQKLTGLTNVLYNTKDSVV